MHKQSSARSSKTGTKSQASKKAKMHAKSKPLTVSTGVGSASVASRPSPGRNHPSKRSFVLGGYDAKSCPTLVMKNFHPNYGLDDQDQLPPGDVARMEEGVVFEDEVGKRWLGILKEKAIVIPACDRSERSKRERERLTLQALQNPGKAKVIWNARLPKDPKNHRTGEPDALIHAGKIAGRHRWIPVDVKHHKMLSGQAKEVSWPVSSLDDPSFNAATPSLVGTGSPRREDGLQLAHYRRMLEGLGHESVDVVGGIIGKEGVILWHRLDALVYDFRKKSALSIYDEEFASRVEIVSRTLDGETPALPEWKSECLSCVWKTSCHDELVVDMDHITLLPGITPDRARPHYATGVSRIADLAHLDWVTARLIDDGVDVPALKEWARSVPADTPILSFPGGFGSALDNGTLPRVDISSAGCVGRLDDVTARYHGSGVKGLAGAIDLARVRKVGKVFLARDVVSVGINRSVYELDVDIEDSDGFVYLIGVRTTGRKSDSGRTESERKRGEGRFEYDAFVTWERSAQAEAKVFADFWAHVQKSREYAKSRGYAWRLYYYTHHEVSSFRRLAERHAGMPGVPTVEEVEALFASKETIDLYRVLVEQLVWPTESVKLKEVAKWVRFSWRDSDPSGSNSLAWYATAISSSDEEERAEFRQRLLDYNEDDVTAQVAIRDWLSRLGEARHPGKKLPNVASLDRRFRRRSQTPST